MNIRQIKFSSDQFIGSETKKIQIYLHHTAGNSNPLGVYKDWESNPERIATCVVVGGDPGNSVNWNNGEIIQGFNSKYWAYHLGLKESTFNKFSIPYRSLDKTSIGVEICNWGQLTRKDDKFYNYVNKIVPDEQVTELDNPFRGYKYFHSYTDEQIESVKELLMLWKDRYKIPLSYNNDIWDVTPRALKGTPGVFTHCSVRYDKVDIYPHPNMVKMLKSL